MTTHFKRLSERLRQTPYLLIDVDGESCRLIGEAEAARLALAGDGPTVRAVAVLPIFRGLPAFVRRCGEEDRDFSLPEISKLADCPYNTLHRWIADGILRMPVRHHRTRKFTWLDAWTATVVGSVRRFGASNATLKRVADVFNEVDQPEVAAEKAVLCVAQ